MNWVYRFDDRALKELRKLGRPAQEKIIAYLDSRIASTEDPRCFGKALKANLAGLWRYRIGDHRLVCMIHEGEMVVLVLTAGHRRDVYE